MVTSQRMSPFTALFLALGFVGAAAIAACTAITMAGLKLVDDKASGILALSQDAVSNLPEFIEKLPPAISDMLHDRRAPEYASHLVTTVRFAEDSVRGGLIPSLEIVNNGEEVVSMLGLRVALLNADGAPVQEWNELAAAPIVFEELRGPLLPGSKRYLVLPGGRSMSRDQRGSLNGVVEICDVRVWTPTDRSANAAVGASAEQLVQAP